VITIAIATHKGGTGKTVTSMALAAALARTETPTVLVDLDPQGHSTLGLGVERRADPGDAPRAARRAAAADRRRRRADEVPQLSIVPSNILVERPAQLLYMRPKRERVLQKALSALHPAPAFVVIDCPPSLGPLTENGIAAATGSSCRARWKRAPSTAWSICSS
jgi:chromosome partitioning protein